MLQPTLVPTRRLAAEKKKPYSHNCPSCLLFDFFMTQLALALRSLRKMWAWIFDILVVQSIAALRSQSWASCLNGR
jgi:hypothetical protein